MFVFCHQWEMMVEAASCLDLPEAVNYPFAEEGGGIGRMWNTLLPHSLQKNMLPLCEVWTPWWLQRMSWVVTLPTSILDC